MSTAPKRERDRKGREYIALGKFMGRYALQVYVSKAAKGERREDGARVVLAGHRPELRVAVDPYQAERLDRRRGLLLLWDRLVHLVDEKVAPMAAAEAYLAAMAAEGIAPPDGPLHQPGVPRRVRLILAYREAHPSASHRMIAKAVGCDPGWVSKALRGRWGKYRTGADSRADSALTSQRKVSAESARKHATETAVSPEENPENRITVPPPESAPPLCTSSVLRTEDDGAPPPDAGVPAAALEGPPRPVVAGHTTNATPTGQPGTGATAGQERRRIPPGLEVVPEDLRPVVWRVVAVEAHQPGRATRFNIEGNGPKVDAELDRAVELGYLAEGGTAATRGSQWWVPKHPRLLELVDRLRATTRSAAS